MAVTAALIGGGIAAATALLSNGYQGWKGEQLAEEQDKRMAQKRKKLSDWYNRQYYADPTQRADIQRLISRTQDTLRERSRASAGRMAVMGGTEESVAAEKEQNSRAVAEMMGNVSAANEARKDGVEQSYMTQDAGLDAQEAQMQDARAIQAMNANVAAIQGVGQAAQNFANAYSAYDAGKPVTATSTSTTGTN